MAFFNEIYYNVNFKKKIYFVFLIILFFSLIFLLNKYHQVVVDYNFNDIDHIKTKYSEISDLLPRLASYFLAERSPIYELSSAYFRGFLKGNPYIHEHQMFFGLSVLLPVIFSIFLIKKKKRFKFLGLLSLGSFCIIFLFTISLNGFSFYKVIQVIPGINSIRAVSRISQVIVLPISILCCIAVNYFTYSKKRNFFIIFVIFIFFLELYTYKNYNSSIVSWKEREN